MLILLDGSVDFLGLAEGVPLAGGIEGLAVFFWLRLLARLNSTYILFVRSICAPRERASSATAYSLA